MKKFSKLFLLALCTGCLFLCFSNIQSEWIVQSGGNHVPPVGIEGNRNGDCVCTCTINLLGFLVGKALIGIGVILGIMWLILSIKALSLCKKSKDICKNTGLFYIPILNLYPISKITIGSIRFFCLMLMLGFFVYSIYISWTYNKCGFDDPSRQEYTGIVVGFFSFIIFVILLSKLSYLANSYKKISDKNPSNQ